MSQLLFRLIASCNNATPGDSGLTGSTGDTATLSDSGSYEQADVSMPPDGSSTIIYVDAAGTPQAYYLGSFYTTTAPYVSPIVFDTPSVPDTCGLTLYTQTVSTGTNMVPQSAGTITLNGPTGSFLPYEMSTGVYYIALDPTTFPFDSTWEMSGDGGGAYPAFAGSIDMPGRFDVIAPAPGFTLQGGLRVAWTTPTVDTAADPMMDPAPMTLRLETVNSATGDGGMVYCTVTNDGEFIIPGRMVNQLPVGNAKSLHMQVRHSVMIGTADPNRSLQLNAEVIAIRF